MSRKNRRDPRAFYDRFQPLYRLADFFLKSQKQRLAAMVNAAPPGDLLEAGVGEGRHLRLYRASRITGIDISGAMLRKARALNPGPHIRLLAMDAGAMTFADAAFDTVVLAHIAAVTPDLPALMAECSRVLRPGGRLIVLNHFTPAGPVGLFDKAVAPIGRLLHLRSVFRVATVADACPGLILSQDVSLGLAGYFRLLSFVKPQAGATP